jgi:hypothetical protein
MRSAAQWRPVRAVVLVVSSPSFGWKDQDASQTDARKGCAWSSTSATTSWVDTKDHVWRFGSRATAIVKLRASLGWRHEKWSKGWRCANHEQQQKATANERPTSMAALPPRLVAGDAITEGPHRTTQSPEGQLQVICPSCSVARCDSRCLQHPHLYQSHRPRSSKMPRPVGSGID